MRPWEFVLLLVPAMLSGATLDVPTYADNIAPLIHETCSPCHQPGGGGPFPLLTFEDVKKHARQIATVTAQRYMPPWLPDAPSGTFLGERRLSQEQIRTIGQWVAARCPSGDLGKLPSSPALAPTVQSTWDLGRPDLILEASKPLHLPASGSDVFWNFLFPTDLKVRRYVKAIEIHPGKDRLVHHANLLVDRTGASLRLDKRGLGGFSGMDVNISRNPLDPESHFLFWKPGSRPYAEPNGFSWELDPGNLLVLNAHLQPSGKPEEVAPSIGLYFTDRLPSEYPILVELQHDKVLDIPANIRNFVVGDELTLPQDAKLLAIYPHAHYLGSLLEAWVKFPDGTQRELIRIPHWDLNQQAVYRYREPILLPRGAIVRMRFHYDNSAFNLRNPNNPPKAVHAGDGAADEMGHLWLQLLPEGRGDHRRPIQEAVIRHRIQQDPEDPTWHLNLGAVLLSRLDAQGAIVQLREAIRLDPKHPPAHDMLGAALQNTGQLQAAIAQFREAIELQPDYMNAHYNLALALIKEGNFEEAIGQLQEVARAYPEDDRLQREYRELLVRANK